MNAPGRLNAVELHRLLGNGEAVRVLDVRRREAWTAEPGHVPGAMWLPLEEVPDRARDLPRDAHLVVYCS